MVLGPSSTDKGGSRRLSASHMLLGFLPHATAAGQARWPEVAVGVGAAELLQRHGLYGAAIAKWALSDAWEAPGLGPSSVLSEDAQHFIIQAYRWAMYTGMDKGNTDLLRLCGFCTPLPCGALCRLAVSQGALSSGIEPCSTLMRAAGAPGMVDWPRIIIVVAGVILMHHGALGYAPQLCSICIICSMQR